MAWFSGNTTFHWNNTPRYSGHSWEEKVQKIKKLYIFVIKLVNTTVYWTNTPRCADHNLGGKIQNMKE